MSDIFTQDVTAWAVVGGTENFQLKSLETTRRTGREIGQAVLKGIPEKEGDVYPAPGADAEVFISTESSTEPWNEDLNTERRVFYGEVMSAKQNREGVITFEVAGMADALHRQRVKLEVENATYTHSVLKNILEDQFGTVHSDLSSATPYQPYLANPNEFTANYQRPWRFGNTERGLPIIDALEQLLESLGGIMWVDRNGILRFEPYPDHRVWRTPLVTNIKSGESTRNKSRVIFESSGTASELGQGASYIHSQTSYNSVSEIKGKEDEPDAPDLTLSDDNVSSQEEADQYAFNAAVSEDQKRDLGKVTIIGNAEIELYDHIIIPEVEYTGDEGLDINNEYQAGRYKVDGVIQKASANDGFLTTIELSPPIDESYRRVALASGAGFDQTYLSEFANVTKEDRVSLTQNGEEDSGTLSGILG
jgi:hypothetical protein